MTRTKALEADLERLLTYADIRRILRISEGKAIALATGEPPELPSVRIGTRRLFRPEDVEAYIDKHTAATSSSGASRPGGAPGAL